MQNVKPLKIKHFLIFFTILLLSASIVNAGFWDWLTGDAIEETTGFAIQKTVCGNDICEDGEDKLVPLACTNSIPPSCTYEMACPQDCGDQSCQQLLDLADNAFGSVCGDGKYDYIADVNDDKVDDILDISLINSKIDEIAWCTDKLTNPVNPCDVPDEPVVEVLTIKGRMIDRFSKKAVPNIAIYTKVGVGAPPSDAVYTNTNGEFAITTSTEDIPTNKVKSFPFWPGCYMASSSIILTRKTDDSLEVLYNPFDLVKDSKILPVAGPEVNFGDMALWPTVNIVVNSDIPVQMNIEYPEEGKSYGNINYKTNHYLSNVIPLNYDARVKLTDKSGIVYVSPSVNIPLSQGCEPVTLDFFNGKFVWKLSDDPPKKVTCTDSDGGINYYVKGYVEFKDDPSFGIDGRKYDKCWDDRIHLTEYVCENGVYKGDHSFLCPDGCEDGACIKSNIATDKPNPPIDLSNYPNMFINNDKFNAILVVGDNAPAEDVISVSDIAISIETSGEDNIYGIDGTKISVGSTRLASEIADPLILNIISVGGPCNNAVSNQLMGTPLNCRKGFTENQGLIQLYNFNEYAQLLVAGYSDADTRKTARVLANWDDHNLKGNEICVYGSGIDPYVGECDGSNKFIPSVCSLPSGIACLDFIVTTSSVDLIVRNSLGNDIELNSIEIPSGNCLSEINDIVSNGDQYIAKIDNCNNGVVGSKFNSDIIIIYTNIDSNIQHKIIGTLTTNIYGAVDEIPEPIIIPPILIKDECQTNRECDDNDACTSNTCSGTPKKCSYVEVGLGCNYDGTCLPFGVRTQDNYCDIDRNVKTQLGADEDCNNNYECSTNVCVNNQCISQNLIQKIFSWFGKLFA